MAADNVVRFPGPLHRDPVLVARGVLRCDRLAKAGEALSACAVYDSAVDREALLVFASELIRLELADFRLA